MSTTRNFKLRVVARNEQAKKALEKVWVNIYSSKLSDEEVRRLASRHNTENHGSEQTKWFQRVTTTRKWLYHMNGKNFHQDETPGCSREWKKACQNMYFSSDKVLRNKFPFISFAFHSQCKILSN